MYILKPVCFVVISAFLFCYAPKRLQLSEERFLVDSVIKFVTFPDRAALKQGRIASYRPDQSIQIHSKCFAPKFRYGWIKIG